MSITAILCRLLRSYSAVNRFKWTMSRGYCYGDGITKITNKFHHEELSYHTIFWLIFADIAYNLNEEVDLTFSSYNQCISLL